MSFDHQPVRKVGRGLLAAAVGLALVVPSAHASGDSIWQECSQTGSVSTNHSQKDFTDALANPPADGAEYSPCTDLIRAAQNKAATSSGSKSNSGTTGAVGGTGGSGGTGSTGGGSPAVDSGALQKALSAGGVNPSAPAGSKAEAPAPAVVDGKKIDLTSDRVPSIAGALSLPLPLAASAVVVLLSAAMPVARYLVARFGGPPTGTTPTS